MSYIPQVQGDAKILRASTTALTSSYDSTNIPVLPLNQKNQAILLIKVAAIDAACTGVFIQIDAAIPAETNTASGVSSGLVQPVSTDWYQLPYQDNASVSASGGIATVPIDILELKFTVNCAIAYPIPLLYKWLRVRAKATGTVGATTLRVLGVGGLA